MSMRRKVGMFLSVELVIVITIIIVILAGVVASMRIVEQYKVLKYTHELRHYSEAMINFNNTYGKYPGELSPSSLAGYAEFANSDVLSNIINNNTSAMFGDGNIWCYSTTDCKMNDSFRLLAVAGLIKPGLVTTTGTGLNVYGVSHSFANLAGKASPISKVNNQYMYSFARWTAANSADVTLPMGGTWILQPVLSEYWPTLWNGVPWLMLHGGNSASMRPHFGTSTTRGGIAPSLAYGIDVKIDDGLPMGQYSKFISTDVRRATVGYGCTTGPETWTGGTNNITSSNASPTQIFNLQYQSGNSEGAKGCQIMYAVS